MPGDWCWGGDLIDAVTEIINDPRGARHCTRDFALQPCIRLDPPGPNHEAIIRFGGKAPRRRAHSNERFDDHVLARVTTTSDRKRPAARRTSLGVPRTLYLNSLSAGQATCRSTTPRGTSPVVTMRQSAMSSLRASATIIFVLRAPLAPSVRLRNH
jgi:hypothetical protein